MGHAPQAHRFGSLPTFLSLRMNDIRISFSGTYEPTALFAWLSRHFPIRVLPEEECLQADYLICDTFNYAYEQFKGVRILLTGENHPADLNHFDYCLSHDTRESDRRHYFPYWLQTTLFLENLRDKLTTPRAPLTAEELREQKRGFCAFVSYNAAAKKRVNFVKHLMKHRRVSCGGPLFNNVGGRVANKIGFLSEHYFSIAYENEASPGYQTEKITDAFIARSIPLYYGNPLVGQVFNPKAFINAADFRNEDELVDYILKLADDEERLLAMLNEQPLLNPALPDEAEAALLAFFTRIFERGPQAIQRTRLQRCLAFLSNFYGHGFFRTYRRISRRIRGKKSRNRLHQFPRE